MTSQAAQPSALPTIVYIEDDPLCADLVRDALATEYTVVCAHDGLDGLERIAVFCPVLILLDLQLPMLSGFGVLDRLRQSDSLGAIPVVAISARVMHDEPNTALERGCREFIEKPFSLATLRQTVARVLKESAP